MLGAGEEAPDTTPNAAQSSFAFDQYTVDTDGMDAATAATTVNNAAGDPLEGISITYALAACSIDADASTFTSDVDEIEDDGVDAANLTLHLYDEQTGAPIPDIAAADLVVTATGCTVTPVDSVTNVSGRFRWSLVSGTASTPTLSVAARGVSITATIAFTVSGDPVEGPATVFESDWGTGTGSGDTEVQDGVWDQLLDGSNQMDVVTPANAESFDTVRPEYSGNVLRNLWAPLVDDGQMGVEDMVAESTTHWVGFFFNLACTGRSDHGFGYNVANRTQNVIQIEPFMFGDYVAGNRADATQPWRWATNLQYAYPQGTWYSPELDPSKWYYVAWEVEYVTATTIRFWPRLYEKIGGVWTLILTSDDFLREGSGTQTLTDWYDIGGENRASSLGVGNGTTADADAARRFHLGQESPESGIAAADPPEYFYVADFKVSTADWLVP